MLVRTLLAAEGCLVKIAGTIKKDPYDMSDREAEIVELERLRAQALVNADVEFLSKITDADYVHVEANGKERDKTSFLAALAAGTRFSRYNVSHTNVRVYGEVAVVTGSFANEMIQPDGSLLPKVGRHCRVYALREDGWRNVLHQATEVSR